MGAMTPSPHLSFPARRYDLLLEECAVYSANLRVSRMHKPLCGGARVLGVCAVGGDGGCE